MIRITATIICCLIARILAAQNPTYAWSASMGADSSDYGIALATDAFDNVYTTGCCTGTVDFDPGPGTYTLGSAAGPAYSGTRDIFVSKMDASGNILWAKRMGDTTFHFATFGNHISVDAGGNVITTGLFTGTVDFDPGAGVFNLSSPTNNGWRIFILKLDATGTFVWA
ncbi:MAG TPA: hypothetical protein PL029_08745, partial [Bacteroidia bacterium]|nr:hypothetical protein [Bacteroidia bacterium]